MRQGRPSFTCKGSWLQLEHDERKGGLPHSPERDRRTLEELLLAVTGRVIPLIALVILFSIEPKRKYVCTAGMPANTGTAAARYAT